MSPAEVGRRHRLQPALAERSVGRRRFDRLGAGGGHGIVDGRGSKNPVPASATQSIAVLPLVDLSAQKDQQYFADGLTEDLLNALANNPQLRVAGRTSAFQFRNSQDDPREIGKKLNVVNLLEGSVRKTDNRVRITARLVNATDGFNLWSETSDREMNDIFAIQADIARSVADALRVTLLGGEQKKSAARGTKPPAYNAYLQGRYFRQLNSKESLEKAIQYFEEAVALDPDYAPAWTGLALAYGSQASEGYSPVTEGYEKARKAVEHALELDPNLGEAPWRWHSSAGVRLGLGWSGRLCSSGAGARARQRGRDAWRGKDDERAGPSERSPRPDPSCGDVRPS